MEYRALYSTIPKRTGETAGRNAWHYVSNSKGGKHCRNPITALNVYGRQPENDTCKEQADEYKQTGKFSPKYPPRLTLINPPGKPGGDSHTHSMHKPFPHLLHRLTASLSG